MSFMSSDELLEKLKTCKIEDITRILSDTDPFIYIPVIDIEKDNMSPLVLDSFLFRIRILEEILINKDFLLSENRFVVEFLIHNFSLSESAKSILDGLQKIYDRDQLDYVVRLIKSEAEKKILNLKVKVIDQICEANLHHPAFSAFLSKIENKLDKDILRSSIKETYIVSNYIKPVMKQTTDGFYKTKGSVVLSTLGLLYSRVSITERIKPTSFLFVEGILGLEGNGKGVNDITLSDETIKALFSIDGYSSALRPNFDIIKNPTQKIEELVLTAGTAEHIKSLCVQFLDLQKRGIKGKLTFLLKGPPGTGKSHCAYAIANLLGRNVVSVNLGERVQQESTVDKILGIIHRAESKNEVILFEECETLIGYNPFTGNSDAWAKKIFERFKGVAIFTTNYNVPYGFERRVDYIADLKRPNKKARALILQKEIEIASREIPVDLIPSQAELEKIVEKFPITGGYYNQIIKLAMSLSPGKREITEKNLSESFESFYSKIPNQTKDEDETPAKISLKDVKLNSDIETEAFAFLYYAQNRGANKENSLLPKGATAVFSGPPGTGKTILAEAIAHELDMGFRKVTPSTFLSKWVGETEQNIKKIFRDAQNKNQVLFIDEAEGLFLDRAGSEKSWERTQTDELLQQVENYTGVLIIATNHKEMMDSAFGRRFLFHFKFSMPDRRTRLELWKSWQNEIQVDDKTLETLADAYDLSGGEIRNIVVQAKIRNVRGLAGLSLLCEDSLLNRTGKVTRKLGM